ncbi:MAG: ATP-binding protein [Desulfobacteraceae bacterium]
MKNRIFKRLSLRSVLIINVIAPLLAAMIGGAYIGLNMLEHIVEERMQEDVQLVARAIRLPVSYSLEKERFGSLSQTLKSVFHIGRVYGAYVFDAEGERIASVGAVEPDIHHSDFLNVTKDGELTGQYEKIQGRRVYSYFVPLFDTAGKSIGLLQIIRKKSDFENYIHRLRIRVAGIIAGAGVLTAVFVLLGFHHSAGRYFEALTNTMAQVRRGKRLHRARETGPREITSLAKSLNTMLDSLYHSEKEISKRRKTQQALEAKLRQSEKMAAIGQLAAGVAHELGGPLSLIDGKAQRCLRDKGITSTHKKTLKDIRNQVRRMDNIVRQLLDFGKGTMRQKRWIQAHRPAGSAVSNFKKEMGGSVQLIFEGSEPAPFLYVDPLRFEQALINLMRNSVQSGEATEIRLSWELSSRGEVVFTVTDNGTGIADDIKPRIFEPFFTTHKTPENTGMGLSVVHGIISEHNGTIGVFDAETGGAGFRITLPPQSTAREPEQGGNYV